MGDLGMAGLGLLLLLLGGDSLLRGAAGLLQRFGASGERTGTLLVAIAFWLPQLAITLQAVVLDETSLAVAGAVGAGVGNLGLLLGLSALVAPLAAGLNLLPALRIFAIVAAGLVLFLARDGVLVAWEGAVLVGAFVAIAIHALLRLSREDAATRQDLGKLAITGHGLVQNLVRLGFAAVTIYFGSRWLAENAAGAGGALGFEGDNAGLFVLGVGASLPAIGMTALSAINGLGRAVLAQAVIASLANLLLAAGLVALSFSHGAPVSDSVLLFGLPAVMAFALLLIPLARAGLPRREAGWLVLAFVAWAIALALA
jgi:cation:H+ antiporter